jgi:hypothetical protein
LLEKVNLFHKICHYFSQIELVVTINLFRFSQKKSLLQICFSATISQPLIFQYLITPFLFPNNPIEVQNHIEIEF